MLRRKSSMAFAPGAFVFPGGSVDARDADEDVAWAGPDATAWGRIFDAPDDLARALVCAAVRETFEESGVLLAGPSAGTVVADTSGDDWESDRNALLDRSISLAGLLSRRRLVLRADLLRPWSRWITPIVEERRFDARFFAAAMPAGQRTRDVGGEAAQVAWVRPADAIAAGRNEEIVLWPPTAVTLGELAGRQVLWRVGRGDHREVLSIHEARCGSRSACSQNRSNARTTSSCSRRKPTPSIRAFRDTAKARPV